MRNTITTTAAVLLTALCSPPVYAGATRHSPDWTRCPVEAEPEERPGSEGLEAGAASLEADAATLVKDGTSVFTGSVELVRDDSALRTDRLTYDDPNEIADAEGHTRLWNGPLFWQGEHAHLDLGSNTAKLERGAYRLLSLHGHGEAGSIETDRNRKRSTLKDVTYTTCPGGKPDWQMAAKIIRLDHNEEWGSARNVVFRIRGVPVAYSPYMSFPLSNRRKSGFLPPIFGHSNSSGADITTPYYWNIAPEMDATLAPRFLGSRGVMLTGEYRYLFKSGHGKLNAQYLPHDNDAKGDDRALVDFQHKQWFASGAGVANINFQSVSDKRYFEDFGNTLSLTSTSFLERRADVTYGQNRWSVSGRVLSYQTVDPALPAANRPYNILPQVYLSTGLPTWDPHLSLNLYAQTAYFDRANTTVGGRLDFKPVLAYRFETPGTFLVPQVSLEHTRYLLDGNTAGSDHITRTVPTFNIDSGMYFERNLSAGGEAFVHTIEPRLYYLYRPKVGQNDIPVFDTGEYDFSFAQLFRDNRFSSIDRLSNANSVSVAVTSRLIDARSGDERLRASIGQIYNFDDIKVTLPGERPITDTTSPVVADVNMHLTSSLAAGGALQWNPNNGRTDKGALRLRYWPGDNKIINLDYRLRHTTVDIEQTDLSFHWPLTRNWGAIGRWNYSVADNRTLEVVGGLEYESCCWATRVVARRFLRTSGGTFDTAVFLQVEFKGLAGLGRTTTSFLLKSIPGYTNDF